MYIQKGTEDNGSYYYSYDYGYRGSAYYVNDAISLHYIQFPFLISLKLSALRLNAGPYYGICFSVDGKNHDDFDSNDFGISMGFGFDIGKFYIGTFYDYGWTDINSRRYFASYNRTLGFNLGVNL
jgi:hypothetical protein